ncbi:glycosyltransferase [Agrobacterium rosae]|uniref:glycosyltransferase n=1 Tax=Agrobacterium rosae TaxID=1972867 RepID=UPI0019D34A73|nr:glycosyltransferase [Agrobacterium rosae]MBN7809072.1 glycosyltransferase [Agrobacterium rosae]
MQQHFQKLIFHVPSFSMFRDNLVEDILKKAHLFDNPLLCLLACRWFEASRNFKAEFFEVVEVVEKQQLPAVMVVSDYASTYDSTFSVPVEELEAQSNLVVKFSCVGDSAEGVLRGALNAFDYVKDKPVSPNGFYNLGTQRTHENQQIITVPLGCGSSWLPKVGKDRGKVILLDEVHSSVIDAFDDNNRFDVLAYNHALNICDHLWARGFRIITFCRSSREFISKIKERHPYIEVIDWVGWMPFSEVVKHYAAATLFFSHFHEAHGYPIYENLQLGNGVIGYAENLNQHVVSQFQNGVVLTSTMPTALAADLVEQYFQRYIFDGLQQIIERDAHTRFSCDTFVDRLITALATKGIMF